VIWEDVGWDRVNCQLYSGWRLGKHKAGVSPNREELVEAAGKTIEVGGVIFGGGVGIGTSREDDTLVVNLYNEALGEEAVRVDEGGGSNVREGGGYALCKRMGDGVGSDSEEGS